MCSSEKLQTELCTFYTIFRKAPSETKCKNRHQLLYYSPLWIRRCSFRWCLYLKALPHSVHLNLRLPAPWVSIWCYKRRKTDISFCRRNKGNLLQIFLKGLYFQTGQKVWVHVYLFAQSFRVAIKVIMLAIKLEQIKKKVLSHAHPTLALELSL